MPGGTLLLGTLGRLFLKAELLGLARLALLFARLALGLLGLAALFLLGLAARLFGGLGRGLSLFGGLALGLDLHLALGDLGTELLADLVHVRLDERRRVILGRDLHRLELVEQLLACHPELFRELMDSHRGHLSGHSPCFELLLARSSSKSRRSLV